MKLETMRLVPSHQRQRMETKPDQAIQLICRARGDDPGARVGFAERLEPCHNVILGARVDLVEAVDQQEGRPAGEGLFDKFRKPAQVEYGSAFRRGIDDNGQRVFGRVERDLQVCNVIEEGHRIPARLQLDLGIGRQRSEMRQCDGFSRPCRADNDHVCLACDRFGQTQGRRAVDRRQFRPIGHVGQGQGDNVIMKAHPAGFHLGGRSDQFGFLQDLIEGE